MIRERFERRLWLTRVKLIAKDQDASAAVVFSLILLPMLVSVGASVDYARLVAGKVRLQSALDAAVLSAAARKASERAVAAAGMLAADLASSGLGDLSATWSTNPDGSFAGAATVNASLFFLPAIGLNTGRIKAVATSAPGSTTSTAGDKLCILVLDTVSPQPLLVSSRATIEAPGCEIDATSTASPTVILNSTASQNVAKICVAGTGAVQNRRAAPALATGCGINRLNLDNLARSFAASSLAVERSSASAGSPCLAR
jgi:Flp pilus assembly protein TadG